MDLPDEKERERDHEGHPEDRSDTSRHARRTQQRAGQQPVK